MREIELEAVMPLVDFLMFQYRSDHRLRQQTNETI